MKLQKNVDMEAKQNHCTYITNPGTGLEKCQYTPQIFTSTENNVLIGIIYQGTGKNYQCNCRWQY